MKENKWWHKNPYRQGYSHELFDYIRDKQLVTKKECRKWLVDEFGTDDDASAATVTTVFSPRKVSKRGDCRGNRSARGEFYYMEKLKRKFRYGVKEPQKFFLRWRERPLDARGKESKVEINQEKAQVKVKKTRAGLLKIRLKNMQKEMKLLEKEMARVR